MPLADEGFLEIDGASLEYRMIGSRPDRAPTIVMLHEGLGSVSAWGEFPQKLAERTGVGVFVYSRAGYGRSSPVSLPRPLDYMQREATDVLPKLLDAIGFRRGVFLGHSDGASIATIYAGSIQDHRVRGLALIAPHFFVEDFTIAEIERAKELYAGSNLRERLARHHGEKVDAMFYGWANHWTAPERRDWTMVERLPAIRCPVLVIQGERDEHGTIAQVEAIEAGAGGPVARYLVPNCGHSPHLEAPAAVVSQVAAFLATAAG